MSNIKKKPDLKPEEELKQIQELLKMEKKAEFEYYRQKVLNSSLEERKNQGVCWYPVELIKHNISTGEKYVVEIERRANLHDPHVFTAGKAISLFVNDGSNNRASAVVNWVKGTRMRFTLNGDLPDWLYDGKLGIDLLFDEASFKAMEASMKQIIEAEGRTKQLRDILLGHKEPSFTSSSFTSQLPLNEAQTAALQNALAAQDVAIIHGPPGTGKTTTLVQVIREVLTTEKQVLVCAPSNAAVDLLADKLSEWNINVLRMGHPARVTEENLPYTMDARMAGHPSYADLKKMRKQAEELKQMAYKYKRHFGQSERQQRKLLLRESGICRDQAEQLEYYILYDIFEKTQVFASTLVGAASHPILGEMNFKTVFIDEAAQALEPACWIPIMKAERVIFAGDHCQLPPTIKSFEAAKAGLSETLFEKCITRTGAAKMLEIQYRMHKDIMNFSSKKFYDNKLKAAPFVVDALLMPEEQPVEFIDTAGSGFAEKLDPESRSLYNEEEGQILFKHLGLLLERLGKEKIEAENLQVGVISPYRAQVKMLSEMLDNTADLNELSDHLDINTVDAFQGQERDVIYISLVRSNEAGEIGFLADIRRMNVAMTRAKKKLVIIGDSATLGNNAFYNDFIDYVNSINAYRSVFEYMYE